MKYTPRQIAKAIVGFVVSAGGIAATLTADETFLSAAPPSVVALLGVVAALGTALAVFGMPNELTEEQKAKAIEEKAVVVEPAPAESDVPVADLAVVERILKNSS